ncbi:MAG: ThiS-like ubiquitin domain-containing protein, partial [Eubacterium sp.]
MYIKVNSKKIDTQERSLYALRDALYHTSDNIVTILEGYQTDEDIPLKEGNEVVFITKGEL